ncbi:tRNA guanosine(34) transglycosylase Tgt [Myxococcota bacterium]|nr:tRNA guanosine(34) transglycosylase Tgt [Myxococcota bacterium]
MEFQVLHEDGPARTGLLRTPHGEVRTPVFMPVGTQAALRAMTPAQVVDTGAQIVLANTYHLSIRPGESLVKKAGGLHRFMAMPLPILTDSGGFQVFSLPGKEVTEEGVRFAYEKGGERVFLSPERSMAIQQDLGADIAMVFDECVEYPATWARAEAAMLRTLRWEARSKQAHARPDQALFAIVQGSTYEDLRRRCAEALVEMDFPGYAVGGLSVGEGLELMERVLSYTTPHLPKGKPRYLMGVGLPEDLLAGIAHGIDMFDCVIPTRHARGAVVYTFQGRMRLTHRKYRRDLYPIDTGCPCYTCRNFSRAYLRHLFDVGEVLGTTLAAIHNVAFLQQLMDRAREAVVAGRFSSYRKEFLAAYQGLDEGGGEGPGPMLDDGDAILAPDGDRGDGRRPGPTKRRRSPQ